MHNYIHVHIELGCLHASTPVYIFRVAMVTTPAPKRPWVRIETTVFCCYGDNTYTQTALGFMFDVAPQLYVFASILALLAFF